MCKYAIHKSKRCTVNKYVNNRSTNDDFISVDATTDVSLRDKRSSKIRNFPESS